MASNEQAPSLVVDNGSGSCKAGLSGNDGPEAVITSLVCSTRTDPKEYFVGCSAQIKRDILDTSYPIQRGVITDWDDMERVWQHLLVNEMGVKPEDHPMLLAEAPLNAGPNREKITEIVFEKLRCPAFYLAVREVLSLYSTGRTTGVVLNSGFGVTHAVPIDKGFALSQGVERVELGGCDLDEYLKKLLTERGYSFSTAAECQIVTSIKEKLGFVAADWQKEELSKATKAFKLPDGQFITVGSEIFSCPEALFNPSLIGREIPSLSDAVLNSVRRCSEGLQSKLFGNVVLSGGTTLFNGLPERLQRELEQAVGPAEKVKTIARSDRKYSAWNGASNLAALSSFQQMWISKQDYEEFGVAIIHKKCA
ncbi:uncharacterized protein LOC129738676 [Uranotaenia lowii]|uniref:uncharacterized protein LOC129738676 n=1 Tax=Uranotaenia lowii TaxID=190385 RepID=UPI00247A86AD|nr:uncharacterized protein LOC129738676 [Uranotaenia lowii]